MIWVLLITLLILNAIFVAVEFGLVKVRATQLEPHAKRGSRAAKLALSMIDRLDSHLTAGQLGITLCAVAFGWISEPYIQVQAVYLADLFGVADTAWAVPTISAAALLLLSAVIIVIGEIVPKQIAVDYPVATMLFMAWPFRIFYWATYPLIWLLNEAAMALVNLLPWHSNAHEIDSSELRLMLSNTENTRDLSLVTRDLLLNALNLKRISARQIMVPRTDISYFSTALSLEKNLEIARKTQHTRFPLGDPSTDHIIGIIHLKDLFWLYTEKGKDADIKSVVRPVLFMPETSPLETLLRTMQSRRNHVAILIDEFGSASGMITLENIIEEIVGDIQDEFDSEQPLWQKIGANEWVIDGSAPIHELSLEFGIQAKVGDASTIGGYIVEQAGKIPSVGDKYELAPFEVIVKELVKNRVTKLLFIRNSLLTS